VNTTTDHYRIKAEIEILKEARKPPQPWEEVEIEPGEALPEAKGRFIANYIGGLRLGLWALTSPYRPSSRSFRSRQS
jgi:hypothetical protein